MIKYEFAYAEKLGKLIHISNVTEEMRKKTDFYCKHPNCNKKMAAHINGSRAKHFQHINYVEHDYETYLHANAILIFKESYQECLRFKKPFKINYFEKRICNALYKETGRKCNFGRVVSTYDLTKYFDKIEETKKKDSFIPDLRIYNSKTDESIFIEVFVTHKSEEEKLNSKYRIIEIKIENEEDILALTKCKIPNNNPKIKFYNFTEKVVERNFCVDMNKGCRGSFEFFVLCSDGTYYFDEEFLNQYKTNLSIEFYGKVVYSKLDPFEKKSFPEKATRNDKILSIINDLKNQYKILDCNLCRYHALNNRRKSNKAIFCKFRKIPVNSDEAFNCEYFRTLTK